MNSGELMTQFCVKTQDKYNYLKLSSAELNLSLAKLTIYFVYDEDCVERFRSDRAQIECALDEILALEEVTVEYIYKRSHFDFGHFVVQSLNFFGSYPSICSQLFDKSFEEVEGSGEISIRVSIGEASLGYMQSEGIVNAYKSFVLRNYSQKIDIEFVGLKDEEVELTRAEYVEKAIYPENILPLIGQPAGDRADFIESITGAREYAVLCGRVSYLSKLEKKNKTGNEEKDSYFKWTLSDLSGSINCLYFPSKKTLKLMEELHDNVEIICSGEIKEDTFREQSRFVFMVRRISFCTIPKTDIPKEEFLPIPKNYSMVFPKECYHNEQLSFIEQASLASSPINERTYVVFDLETTGLSSENHEIIEIGAVKIKNGAICEEFSTLVKPLATLDRRITEITGLKDEDLLGAPSISEVIADFAKFVDGAILVAHNLPFDIGFVAKAAKEHKYPLPSKGVDTIELAKKALPNVRSYSLASLTKFLSIDNKHAHRAVHDARATAELFLKLVLRLDYDQIAKIS